MSKWYSFTDFLKMCLASEPVDPTGCDTRHITNMGTWSVLDWDMH